MNHISKTEISNKLREAKNDFKALIGFDGFVDEIMRVVDKRIDAGTFIPIPTIAEYVERLRASIGLSTNIELVVESVKLGGNGPILSDALCKYGFDITYIGATGVPEHHEVFQDLAQKAKVIGLCNPGETQALEFNDGKLIISVVEHFKHISWAGIVNKINAADLAALVDKCSLIGMENWNGIPYMNDIMENFLAEITPRINPAGKVVFFDLADTEKRPAKEIKEALALIGQFKPLGYTSMLGLNKKEACDIAKLYGKKIDDFRLIPKREVCEFVYHSTDINVSCLIVHPTDSACCSFENEYFEVEGFYCPTPKITTGAGDVFNSGFLMAYLNGFSLAECLLCGVGASGYYVRTARSPNATELADYLSSPKSIAEDKIF